MAYYGFLRIQGSLITVSWILLGIVNAFLYAIVKVELLLLIIWTEAVFH